MCLMNLLHYKTIQINLKNMFMPIKFILATLALRSLHISIEKIKNVYCDLFLCLQFVF